MMQKIKWPDVRQTEERKLLPEVAALMGLYSCSAVFPVVCDRDEEGFSFCISEGEEQKSAYERIVSCVQEMRRKEKKQRTVPSEYRPAPQGIGPVQPRYERKIQGLEDLFRPGFVLFDDDCDGLNDRVDLRILRPHSESAQKAACDFAFRLGMETTRLPFPLVVEEDDGITPLLQFAEEGEPGMELVSCSPRILIRISGTGDKLERFISEFCENFGPSAEDENLTDCCEKIRHALEFRNRDGQLAYLEGAGDEAFGKKLYSSRLSSELAERASLRWPKTQIIPHYQCTQVYEKAYTLQWEYDRAMKEVEHVLPLIKPGDQVHLDAALSENKEVRTRFAASVKEMIEEKGAVLAESRVLCAYKQGYSWLEEAVVPSLKSSGKKPARIEIAWKPFLKPGETDWGDAKASLQRAPDSGSDPEKWLDMPIRRVQELYPVDEVIAPMLGMNKDDIKFAVYEGQEDISYLCTAEDEDGNLIFQESFCTAYSERPYMDAFPSSGKVHPFTGYLRMQVNERKILDTRIPTDLETVWDLFQAEILPYCRRVAEEKCGGTPSAASQPFFGEIALEIGISEPEYRIGVREDLFSPLDALHEDIYFVSQEYFRVWGQMHDQKINAPGNVVPHFSIREGDVSVRLKHFNPMADRPCADFVRPLRCDSVRITKVEPGLHPYFEVCGEDGLWQVLQAYSRIVEEGFTWLGDALEEHSSKITFLCGGHSCTAVLPCRATQDKEPTEIHDIDIPEDQLIGYDQCMEILDRLKQVEGVTVFSAEESHRGRGIPVVVLEAPFQGYRSRVKRITDGPVLLLCGRHHANEISATNGLLRVLKSLLTDPQYKGVRDEMTIIIMPFKNPDGGVLHQDLAEENGQWKFHAARYNALGHDFGGEYFDRNSIHPEALAVQDVYLRWLPDVICDFHGVPSHEWEQQFSGYASPMFRDFWIPRSLLYGYYMVCGDEPYEENRRLSRQLQKAVTESQRQDKISEYNKICQERHLKYARQWMPGVYHVEYDNGTVNYTYPIPYHPSIYCEAVRYPWITAVSYTGEVADETAEGEYLGLCTYVEEQQILSVIDRLREAACMVEEATEDTGEGLAVCRVRRRPVAAG